MVHFETLNSKNNTRVALKIVQRKTLTDLSGLDSHFLCDPCIHSLMIK